MKFSIKIFYFQHRRQVQPQVEKIRHHRRVTHDEAHRQPKVQVEQREFPKILATLNERQMELLQQLKCKQRMQC